MTTGTMEELRKKYEVVIGLEVHAQLKTKSKIFACDSTEFGNEQNTQISPITLGMPGVLPVLNKEAVNMAILTGLALNCTIPQYCKFDRKQYFYPGLPKGYQIAQYDQPICVNGYIDIEGKNAVVLGRSNIVGKPMVQCLLAKHATVTVCHSRTKNLKSITSNADILVVAIGKPKYVKADMVKEGAVVIDVGINRNEEGKICGDVDYKEVLPKVSKITPVPGGVGPMTIAMLLYNLVKATKKQIRK